MQQLPGAFPIANTRAGDLGTIEATRSPETWQIAFLGGTEPRAARPGKMTRRVMRVGRRVGPAVKSHRWLCLITNLMDLRVVTNTNRRGAAGWRTLVQGGAKAPRHPSTPRGLFYAPGVRPKRIGDDELRARGRNVFGHTVFRGDRSRLGWCVVGRSHGHG
jgi:hypothetical protein